ncbi:12048_t:CDS:2 [Acaulospora morrowiae]|uniref:12048_t:CDS:1 n=1 Tax=Acaulospora morrowiae TaxID=94023 RepID=A0A9N8YWB5_9GLOM|nr:12048_t:CDS:2 [Acaulospora morrowiae]
MEKGSRLSVLADNILASIVERNRCRKENIEYPHEDVINKNLVRLQTGIKELEQELSSAEESGIHSSKDLKGREDTLIKLTKEFEKLSALMQDDISTRELLLGINAIPQTSTASKSKTKTVRFSDPIAEINDMDNTQVLLLQERIIREQDEDLDRLDAAIGRQRELSIMIGEELDSHIELLTDTEAIVNQTDGKLNKAKRGLLKISKKAQKNGSTCLVASLDSSIDILYTFAFIMNYSTMLKMLYNL